jgi:hypothetical protein
VCFFTKGGDLFIELLTPARMLSAESSVRDLCAEENVEKRQLDKFDRRSEITTLGIVIS